jgi:hypothetical protein
MEIEANARDLWVMQNLRTPLAIAFVWVAATAFFFTIIGVFGTEPALAALALFIALACVLAVRSQRLEDRP